MFSYFRKNARAVVWTKRSLYLAKTDKLRILAAANMVTISKRMSDHQLQLRYSLKFLDLSIKLGNNVTKMEALLGCCLSYSVSDNIVAMQAILDEMQKLSSEDQNNGLFKGATLAASCLLSAQVYDLDACQKNSKEALKVLNKVPHSIRDHLRDYSLEFKAWLATWGLSSNSSYGAINLAEKCMFVAAVNGWRSARELTYMPVTKVDVGQMERHVLEVWKTNEEYRYHSVVMGGELVKKMHLAYKAEECIEFDKYQQAEEHATQLLLLSQEPFHPPCHCLALSLLGWLASMYAMRKDDENNSGDLTIVLQVLSIIQIMESFFSEAVNLEMNPNRRFAYKVRHGHALAMNTATLKNAESKLLECVQEFFEMEKRIPLDKWISYSSKVRGAVYALEIQLKRTEQVKKALIWSERLSSRHLTHHIGHQFDEENTGEEYRRRLSEFDKDDEKAWNEIKTICEIACHDTVFLKYSWSWSEPLMVSYLLHARDEPLAGMVYIIRPYAHKIINISKTHLDQTTLEMLFKLLIKPWKKQLESLKPKRLVIVSSSEFSRVPFAAMYDTEKKEYLIQRYAVSCVPSLRVFYECEERRHQTCRIVPNEMSALVVGDPTTKRMASLNGAELEADDVYDKLTELGFNHVTILKQEKATPEKVREKLLDCHWVHIAAHGIVDFHRPRGAIMLAWNKTSKGNSSKLDGSSSTTRGEPLEDDIEDENSEEGLDYEMEDIVRSSSSSAEGDLSGDDIEKVGRLKASVVILSCCMSGLGKFSQEGTQALFRSLHMAGVPTVVCSLWKVRDHITRSLMQELYNGLSSGNEIGIALQQAMNSTMERLKTDDKVKEESQKVAGWAPFFISGSPFTRLC